MLSLHTLRTQKDFVIDRLKIKNFKDLSLVDKIIEIDEKRRKVQTQYEDLLSKINSISKEIGKKMASGQKEEAEKMKQEVLQYKEDSQSFIRELELLEKQQHESLVLLPNLPHASVPQGKGAEDNEVVRVVENIPTMQDDALPHWDLCSKYQLIDFELGTKITGAGFPVYKNKGAKLQRALINFFLDYNIQSGYTEYQPPILVNTDSAYGTGQLPDKEGQMYHATVDDFYLIPTAEVPLTNFYRDEILKETDLPLKLTAYTPCFRREAGSYGKDVRGLNRLHQFDKIEIVRFSHPDTSYDALEEMVLHVEKLIQLLELPYRILRLCGGDMSFASALTYDFEVFSAAQKRWLEVSSVSNFETFQTNRMKIRFKNADGKTQLVHSLNGSSLALPRIVASLLENNQTQEGIKIPKALVPYFGAEWIN
ncbi:MAG TPA: serine--tRNA ligase [Chitinophagaceae bacterium]|nr:MAG: seryl-tRNA synthetase [Bacteroidetes bacterium OLB11]HMN32048.1 serine--tRNA ligase [Chitinophagaceae bacterium]